MTDINRLAKTIETELPGMQVFITLAYDELTLECSVQQLCALLQQLKSHEAFACDELIDLCAVDYLSCGQYEWETDSSANTGFSRGVEKQASDCSFESRRFAVVYHLLSTTLNHRIRVKVFLDEKHPVIPSVHHLWKTANWFEREAYDLYGILFENHPDLRRILTDYGFIGHPFRKDFPLSGYVEMRYDAHFQKVIYEPVDIEPRTLVPKVIRDDSRYTEETGGES